MGILNYTTSVPAAKSIGEITSLLVRKQARSITTEFDESGETTAVSFILSIGGIPVRFLLPSKVDGVFRVMVKDKPYSSRTRGSKSAYEKTMREQSVRVAWRILKDWVEAQIALCECGQAEVGQVFMPYATQSNGETMYQLWVANNQKQLGCGEDPAETPETEGER